MNGLSISADGEGVVVAVQAPLPVVLRLSGESLAELTAACLQAFRAAGGRLFDKRSPVVCMVSQDRRWKRLRGVHKLANVWRDGAANENGSDFTRGVVAGRLGCAVELERALNE